MVDVIVLINTAIVLYLQAQTAELGILPEVQATRNFHVSTGGGLYTVIGLVVEVVIYKEEGISPIVIVETLDSSSDVLTVTAEIVKQLNVGLGLGQLTEAKHCNSNGENSFFRHKA